MKNTKFHWQCIHCKARNVEIVKFQFDIPKRYVADWNCGRCGKLTKITFTFDTDFTANRPVQQRKKC